MLAGSKVTPSRKEEGKKKGLCYCKWFLNGSKALLMSVVFAPLLPCGPNFVSCVRAQKKKKKGKKNIKDKKKKGLYCFRIKYDAALSSSSSYFL